MTLAMLPDQEQVRCGRQLVGNSGSALQCADEKARAGLVARAGAGVGSRGRGSSPQDLCVLTRHVQPWGDAGEPGLKGRSGSWQSAFRDGGLRCAPCQWLSMARAG